MAAEQPLAAEAFPPPTGRSLTLASARSYDPTMAVAIRQQMEHIDEKLQIQLSHWQQQSERVREASFARLEEKICARDVQLPRLDRRLAEVTGTCSGLSDELQCQIRRLDSIEERLWEWRHQLEDMFREKVSELESSVSSSSSTCRVVSASLDELQKSHNLRMQRLEEDARDRYMQMQENQQAILEWQERCSALEVSYGQAGTDRELFAVASSISIAENEVGAASATGVTAALELLRQDVRDLTSKVDEEAQAVQEVRGGLESQEERMKVLRTRVDRHDEAKRWFPDRTERESTAGALDSLKGALAVETQGRIECFEMLELLSQRVRLLEEQGSASPSAQPREHCGQQEQVAVLMEEWSIMQAERTDLAPRIGDLVSELSAIVPKVLDHDEQLRSLRSGPAANAKEGEATVASPLADEVSALVGKLSAIMPKLVEQEQAITALQQSLSEEQPELAEHKHAIHKLEQKLDRAVAEHRQSLSEVGQKLDQAVADMAAVSAKDRDSSLTGPAEAVKGIATLELQRKVDELSRGFQQVVFDRNASELQWREELRETLSTLQGLPQAVAELRNNVKEQQRGLEQVVLERNAFETEVRRDVAASLAASEAASAQAAAGGAAPATTTVSASSLTPAAELEKAVEALRHKFDAFLAEKEALEAGQRAELQQLVQQQCQHLAHELRGEVSRVRDLVAQGRRDSERGSDQSSSADLAAAERRLEYLDKQLDTHTDVLESLQSSISRLKSYAVNEQQTKDLVGASLQHSISPLRADVDSLRQRMQLLEEKPSRHSSDPRIEMQLSSMREVEASLHAEMKDIRRRMQEAVAETCTGSEKEREVLAGVQRLSVEVEQKLAALPDKSAEIRKASVAFGFSPEVAEQLESLLDRMEKNEAQCFALQENIRGSIKDLTETVPFTVESLARLVGLLNSSLDSNLSDRYANAVEPERA